MFESDEVYTREELGYSRRPDFVETDPIAHTGYFMRYADHVWKTSWTGRCACDWPDLPRNGVKPDTPMPSQVK